MWRVCAVVLMLACNALVSYSTPTSYGKNPCSAARLHVQAPNNVAGSWSVHLGQLQGHVQHEAKGGEDSGDQTGVWESSVYNRDDGCSDQDVQLFEGTHNGAVIGGEENSASLQPGGERAEGLSSYTPHLQPASWKDAELQCLNEGAHLAVVNSKQEAATLERVLPAPGIHVGLYWSQSEQDFVTVQGTPIGQVGYEIWGRGQPDEYSEKEVCVEMTNSGELSDIPCSRERPFICEINS